MIDVKEEMLTAYIEQMRNRTDREIIFDRTRNYFYIKDNESFEIHKVRLSFIKQNRVNIGIYSKIHPIYSKLNYGTVKLFNEPNVICKDTFEWKFGKHGMFVRRIKEKEERRERTLRDNEDFVITKTSE